MSRIGHYETAKLHVVLQSNALVTHEARLECANAAADICAKKAISYNCYFIS